MDEGHDISGQRFDITKAFSKVTDYGIICAESEKAYQKNEEIKKNLHMHIKEAYNQQTNL